MHVHIDKLRIDVDEEDDGGMAVEVERVGAAVRGVRQDAVLHQPAVDEEELVAAAAEAETARDEAGGVNAVDRRVDLLEVRRGVVADDLHDPFAHRRRRREIDDRAAVVLDAERSRGERQRVRGDDCHDGAELGVGGLEELAPGGDVLEQLAHADGRSAVARGRARRARARERVAFDLDRGVGVPGGRGQCEAGDAGDRRQCLAAEAQGADLREIVEAADLRGGVALEGQQGVVVPHPRAVVAHLDQLFPAVLEDDVDDRCSGVDGILDELFDDRGRALHDLAGSDLVDEIGREEMDAGH